MDVKNNEELFEYIYNLCQNASINKNKTPEFEYIDEICKMFRYYPGILTYQDEKTGRNPGMIAAIYGLEAPVLDSILISPESLEQQDITGSTVAMYCANLGLTTPLNQIIDKNISLRIQNKTGYTVGMFAADSKLEDIVLKILESDEYTGFQQDFFGQTIGIKSANRGLKKVVEKIADNEEECKLCDRNGINVGIAAASNRLDDVLPKLLKNKEACKQVDRWGRNINKIIENNKLLDEQIGPYNG